MACFWPLYQKYLEIDTGKNWIINLKRNGCCSRIKIVSNKFDIDVNKQLKVLNDLYVDFGIRNYGYDNFFAKEIIAVKKSSGSIFIFTFNKLSKNNAEYLPRPYF